MTDLNAAFERAVDAIVTGDIETLRALIAEDATLVHRRSTRAHASTLLHYVSANGVEDVRQRTPANILEITRLLLDSAAEVDATSNAYGGGSTTLGLAATSAHPRLAGVQIALIDLLLEYGARIDGEEELPRLVNAAIANGCPEAAMALATRGGRVNTLYAAAGVGDMARVQTLFESAGTGQRERALSVAAMLGHTAIVRFLLDNGVDVAASDGMTALHHASAGGHIDTMTLLLERGAPLEALNSFGGTVLSSTLWFAHNVTDEEFRRRNFPRAIKFLIAAAAKVEFYPELQREIDGMYERAARLTGQAP